MDVFTWLWVIWIAMFGAIEGTAIIKKTPGATLTSHVISWASLKDKPSGWIARRASLAGFLGWLIYHFFSRADW